MPKKTTTRKAKAALLGNIVNVPNEREANSLYQKSFFGEMQSGGSLELSIIEALYLLEKSKLELKEGSSKVNFEKLMQRAEEENPNIGLEYKAYSDLRERGHIVKSGFKFGTHFRIYERGSKIGEDHSTYLVHVVPEHYEFTATELSRMIRLAHSVRKKLWLVVVDSDGGITYYDIERIKP